jgi:hypothetical protein
MSTFFPNNIWRGVRNKPGNEAQEIIEGFVYHKDEPETSPLQKLVDELVDGENMPTKMVILNQDDDVLYEEGVCPEAI